ncbi:GNAT family N-acetyltransferase [Paenibacillus sp. H1-7]|nr:GNAT family N-acetyltransferase [Paenibacillus sp. H1-7]
MSEVYRLARPEDAEEVLRIIRGAYASLERLGIEFRAVHADLAMVRDNIIHHSCFVLFQGDAMTATISLRSLEEVTEYPFLYWFAVDPLVNGRGVGTKLLTFAEETVVRDTMGAPAVTLATSLKHPWLLPMYERRGYERFYERELGKDDKLVFLSKRLLPEAQTILS